MIDDYIIHEASSGPALPSYAGSAWDDAGIRVECQASFSSKEVALRLARALSEVSCRKFLVWRVTGPQDYELVKDAEARPEKLDTVLVVSGSAPGTTFVVTRYVWSDDLYGYCYDAYVGSTKVAGNAGFDDAMASVVHRLGEAARRAEQSLADLRTPC